MLKRHHTARNTLVLDELGLMHGTCRADIAVVNGQLIGYEIKSDMDSLLRLRSQVAAYNAVFDSINIIVGLRHRPSVMRRVPKYWGIILSKKGKRGAVHFEICRKSRPNPSIDPISVAQLLWRSEAIELLQSIGAPKKLLKSPRAKLYHYLSRHMPLEKLKRNVRGCLRSRATWRCRQPLFARDDLFRPTSMS
jgi:hypothetical protein